MLKLKTLLPEDITRLVQLICLSGALDGRTTEEADQVIVAYIVLVDDIATHAVRVVQQRLLEEASGVVEVRLREERAHWYQSLRECWADQVN